MARGVKTNADLVTRCIQLRVQDRMSYLEIEQLTGVKKGTLSTILKAYPLTAAEVYSRTRHQVLFPKEGHTHNKKVTAILDEGNKANSLVTLLAGKTLTRENKGRVAEAAILLRLAILGIPVYSSPFDNEKDDWLVKTPSGRYLSLQVRWVTWYKQGAPTIRLTRTMTTGTRVICQRLTEYDIIIGYDIITDSAYVFTKEEVLDRKTSKAITSASREAWHKLS